MGVFSSQATLVGGIMHGKDQPAHENRIFDSKIYT